MDHQNFQTCYHFFVCVMIKFIFLFWCSKKNIIFAIFWCVTLFVQPEKDEWWECPRPKKNCWLDHQRSSSLYLWMARDAEKKVNCILGSRQTDDLKTLFALDPGETKQRLMRLWSVLQVVFLKQYIGYLVVSILVLSSGPTLFSHLPTPMVEVRQGGYIQISAKIWRQEIILGLSGIGLVTLPYLLNLTSIC